MFESYDDVLTVEEACEALKIGYNAIYGLLNTGKLRGYRNGRVWRIPKTAIVEYIRNCTDMK
ncbi:helix-turn-helix domain-containing protein [Hominicoprocola fusiformis]|jgi:excisionase family DNA binding protein|nr:helix-turn-helix domain-containing protein [Hominicoprocola fusiformis]